MPKQAASKSPPRQAVLVLGMHRSGTSLLTRILSLHGCGLPATLMPASATNETGYWESMAVKKLNDRILSACGSYWSDWRAVPAGTLKGAPVAEFAKDAATLLVSEFGDAPLLVLKDPRMSRLMPFWLSVLKKAKIKPRIVLALRNPAEVAASLNSRNGMIPAQAHLAWLHHLLQAEVDTRSLPRCVVAYQNILSDWMAQMGRAEAALKMAWPHSSADVRDEVDAVLSTGLQHYQETDQDFINDASVAQWVRDAYAILLRWSVTGEDAADHPALDAIRTALAEAEQVFGHGAETFNQLTRENAKLGVKVKSGAAKLAEMTKRAKAAEADMDQNARAFAQEVQRLRRQITQLQWDADDQG